MRTGRRAEKSGGGTAKELNGQIGAGRCVEEAGRREIEDPASSLPLVGDPTEEHPEGERDERFCVACHGFSSYRSGLVGRIHRRACNRAACSRALARISAASTSVG